jgi:hypothetical protein
MVVHRQLNNRDMIVTFKLWVAILEVEAHKLVFILAKPLLVHVHNLGRFMVVIGVDNLNLGQMCNNLMGFSIVTPNLCFLINVTAVIANLLFLINVTANLLLLIHVTAVIANLAFLIH